LKIAEAFKVRTQRVLVNPQKKMLHHTEQLFGFYAHWTSTVKDPPASPGRSFHRDPEKKLHEIQDEWNTSDLQSYFSHKAREAQKMRASKNAEAALGKFLQQQQQQTADDTLDTALLPQQYGTMTST